jgi:hypothetical protein
LLVLLEGTRQVCSPLPGCCAHPGVWVQGPLAKGRGHACLLTHPVSCVAVCQHIQHASGCYRNPEPVLAQQKRDHSPATSKCSQWHALHNSPPTPLPLAQVKLIDFGAACDLCTGINFNPEYGMLDPRYAGTAVPLTYRCTDAGCNTCWGMPHAVVAMLGALAAARATLFSSIDSCLVPSCSLAVLQTFPTLGALVHCLRPGQAVSASNNCSAPCCMPARLPTMLPFACCPAAPEELVLPKTFPKAPPPALAATLAPVIWTLGAPDLFDSYSAGCVLMQASGWHAVCWTGSFCAGKRATRGDRRAAW